MSTPLAPGVRPLPALSAPIHARQAVDRTKVDPQIVQAAEGMEAMFLDYLMKVMRDTVPSSEYSMDTAATKIYRSMMDSEFSQTAARNGGVGLADQIIASLAPNSYNQKEPSGTEPAVGSRTGGSK